jgi:hypothetical protein
MKKVFTIGAVAISSVLTVINASDFSFEDMFKDMKDARTTMSYSARDTADSMKDGTVETGRSAEKLVSNVSGDARISAVKVKNSEITTVRSGEVSTKGVSKDAICTTVKIAEDSKDSINNTSKDMKDSTIATSHDFNDASKTYSNDMRRSTSSNSGYAAYKRYKQKRQQ